MLIQPLLTLKPIPSNPKTCNEAQECDTAEDAPGEGFAFRMDASSDGEEAAGEEGAGGSAGGGEGLGEAVERTEDVVIRC